MRARSAAIVCSAVALAAGGCGDGGRKSTSAGTPPTVRRTPAPAYRAGQFCFPREQAQYRAAGFVCTRRRHLRRR